MTTSNNSVAGIGDKAPTIAVNDLSRADFGIVSTAVQAVLSSTRFVLGDQVRGFEADLSAFLDAKCAVGVGNGTDALELAFRAVMPPDRPVVVTAANAGGYSMVAARRAGFGVRFADVDEDTQVVSLSTLSEVLDNNVGAVVVTHLYGRAADVPGIRAVCEPLGVAVVEDCAQAIGARLPEGHVGSLGDIAAFSFYPTKNLGAIGDGGAVVTNSDSLAAKVRQLRQYGWNGKYQIDADGGRNSRLDEVQAAVLRARLPFVNAWNQRRREIVGRYVSAASGDIRVLPAEGEGHAAHLGVVVCDDRTSLAAHLAMCGIASDVHYPIPDHKQPAFASEYSSVRLPVTERLAGRVLSVPLFPELQEDEIDRVCEALRTFQL